MKKLLKIDFLPILMLLLGGAAMGLRELLYRLAVDAQNLMTVNHPMELVIYGFLALVAALVIALVVPLRGTKAYEENFPASSLAAGGSFLMALGIFLTVLLWEPAMGGMMGRVWYWLGLAASVGLLWAGYCRIQGKKPTFAAHMAVCLFLAVHIVSHYQTWSREACLQDYFFTMLAGIALLLFAYYQTAFDVDLGQRRRLLAAGLLFLFFGSAALNQCGYWLLYGCGLLWVGTNLPSWHVSAEPEKEEAK